MTGPKKLWVGLDAHENCEDTNHEIRVSGYVTTAFMRMPKLD